MIKTVVDLSTFGLSRVIFLKVERNREIGHLKLENARVY